MPVFGLEGDGMRANTAYNRSMVIFAVLSFTMLLVFVSISHGNFLSAHNSRSRDSTNWAEHNIKVKGLLNKWTTEGSDGSDYIDTKATIDEPLPVEPSAGYAATDAPSFRPDAEQVNLGPPPSPLEGGDAECEEAGRLEQTRKLIDDVKKKCYEELSEGNTKCSTMCKSTLSRYMTDPCTLSVLSTLTVEARNEFELTNSMAYLTCYYPQCRSSFEAHVASCPITEELDKDTQDEYNAWVNGQNDDKGDVNYEKQAIAAECPADCRSAIESFHAHKCSETALSELSAGMRKQLRNVIDKSWNQCQADEQGGCTNTDVVLRTKDAMDRVSKSCAGELSDGNTQCGEGCKGALTNFKSFPCADAVLAVMAVDDKNEFELTQSMAYLTCNYPDCRAAFESLVGHCPIQTEGSPPACPPACKQAHTDFVQRGCTENAMAELSDTMQIELRKVLQMASNNCNGGA